MKLTIDKIMFFIVCMIPAALIIILIDILVKAFESFNVALQ